MSFINIYIIILLFKKDIKFNLYWKSIEIVVLVFCNMVVSISFYLNFVYELMILSFRIVKDFKLVSNGYEVD